MLLSQSYSIQMLFSGSVPNFNCVSFIYVYCFVNMFLVRLRYHLHASCRVYVVVCVFASTRVFVWLICLFAVCCFVCVVLACSCSFVISVFVRVRVCVFVRVVFACSCSFTSSCPCSFACPFPFACPVRL